MNSDNENFLNSVNHNEIAKEKRIAKLMIFIASLGVFAGISATYVFIHMYNLIETPILAFISGVIASGSIYIHIQYVRNYWQIWTYQLKYWTLVGFVLQGVFVVLFIVCISLGIYNQQNLDVKSFYVTSVWAFMGWKWSFVVYYRSKKYRKMFTRYTALLESESEAFQD